MILGSGEMVGVIRMIMVELFKKRILNQY